MSDDHKEFNAEKIFLWLFIFTAVEVGYGYVGDALGFGRVLLWGGLGFFAFLKGYLILTYFMHFKYEGWIIKGLIVPTPFLIAYMMTILRPDVGANNRMDFPVGSQLDYSVVTDEHHKPVMDEDGLPERHETFSTVLLDMGKHDASEEENAGGGH